VGGCGYVWPHTLVPPLTVLWPPGPCADGSCLLPRVGREEERWQGLCRGGGERGKQTGSVGLIGPLTWPQLEWSPQHCSLRASPALATPPGERRGWRRHRCRRRLVQGSRGAATGGSHRPQCRGACRNVGLPQALTPGAPSEAPAAPTCQPGPAIPAACCPEGPPLSVLRSGTPRPRPVRKG